MVSVNKDSRKKKRRFDVSGGLSPVTKSHKGQPRQMDGLKGNQTLIDAWRMD